MLLTDGNPNTNEDLRAYESAILNVAKTESIDLDVKRTLATEEVAQEVLDFLLNRATGTDPRGSGRRAAGVGDVVVTRQMRRWHALHTLAVFYRDAFHNQLNDRYRAQFAEYRQSARRAKVQTLEHGVGLVLSPLPVVEQVEFDFVAGPFPETLYYVRVAWTGAGDQEGAPSAATSYSAPAGSVPVVRALHPPTNATGFRVYMGLTPHEISRQGSGPTPVGEDFTLPFAGLVEGAPVGEGQEPDVYLTGGPAMRRG